MSPVRLWLSRRMPRALPTNYGGWWRCRTSSRDGLRRRPNGSAVNATTSALFRSSCHCWRRPRMVERFLPEGVDPPDFYVAAIGRSGSTLLCNWLASPPQRLVFLEPFFLRPENSRLLRIQL